MPTVWLKLKNPPVYLPPILIGMGESHIPSHPNPIPNPIRNSGQVHSAVSRDVTQISKKGNFVSEEKSEFMLHEIPKKEISRRSFNSGKTVNEFGQNYEWDLGWDLGFGMGWGMGLGIGMGLGFGIWDGMGWDGMGF